jgi:1-aminocyclopropane-1-carboxylate deaminase/D-cysteine desulfhydrase-like pyridoxal-dependent ACC family enzyme
MPTNQPLLFNRFPQLGTLPWTSLAMVPTPVEALPQGLVEADAWIKRDDLTSQSYGGNKVRKLEFLLAHASARGARRLITVGAAGSHHALATAVFGRQLDFDVSLVLFPQPLTDHVREVLLTDAALGAELRYTPRMTMVPAALTAARLAHWRERVQMIPAGGSNEIGTLGYINATIELADQIESGQLPVPDAITLALGTLGTTAGIAIGLTLLQLPIRVYATRITSKLVANERALHSLIEKTCRLLQQRGVTVSAADAIGRITFSHAQIGPGYGQGTEAAEAARIAFERVGLQLDLTYTAKAAADFFLVAKDPTVKRVLFWHTLSGCMPPVQLASVDALPRPFRDYLLGRA